MNENILRKIRALLAKAEDPAATPEEAATYSAKVEQLVADYAVDRALLNERQQENRETPEMRTYPDLNPYPIPKAQLLAAIATAYNAQVIMQRRRSTGRSFVIIGFPSDLEVIDLLYTSLLLQGTNAMLHQPETDRSFRSAYWYGFSNRVARRLAETKQRTEEQHEQAAPGTSLVLASRADEVDAHLRGAFPRATTHTTRPRISSRSGFGAGTTAGNQANLGTTSLGGARRALSNR